MVAWCALIFLLSAQPDLRIARHDMLDLVLRKAAHMGEFGVLALLASMTLAQEGAGPAKARLGALSFAAAYASSDEFHQTFVAGRHGSPVDVGIDTVGAAIALAALHARSSRSRRASNFDAPPTGGRRE